MAKSDYKETPASARMALYYVTFGALMMVWTAIWFLYLERHQPVRDATWLWCLGLFLTGLTFLGIGLTVGHIGRAARKADINAPVATAVLPPPASPAAPEQQAAVEQQVPGHTI
jgi:hypothetical protein